MANKTAVAAKATSVPSREDLDRVSEWSREPIADDPEALRPGTARRMAVDAAIAEIEAGVEEPSPKWRQDYSLVLGLERLLDQEEPHLEDGTELSPHQVDALSGTLTALVAEIETRDGGAPAIEEIEEDELPELEDELPDVIDEIDAEVEAAVEVEDEEEEEEEEEAPPEDDEPDAPLNGELDEDAQLPEQPEDPGAARRFWFEHATGAGKTVAALGFVEASRTGGILILTHRRNLVDQFLGELRDRGYRDRISPPLLSPKDSGDGPVTVETYQWFVRNGGKISDAYTIVICDEAHTALGEKTSASIRRWKEPVFVGMTATGALIARHVADLFPTQTSRFDLAQAARRGVIAPLRCVRIPPGTSVHTLTNVPLRKGEVDQDFDQQELAELLDQGPFNAAVADLYSVRFRNLPGIVYSAGVKHAKNVAASFKAAGMKAEAVSGETPKRELAEILAAFERGEIDVLINAMLLAEGWNSPRATVCMHLAPTASRRIYQQRVGRVTRRNPGKEAGIVVDFVHPSTSHDEPIITLHKLLDRDVYRGGAIVVGPVRRGRGASPARRAPDRAGHRRLGAPPEGLGTRVVADRRRVPAARPAARLGGAGRRARRAERLATCQGDAAQRSQRRAAPALPADLRAAQPQHLAASASAGRDRRATRRRGLRRGDRDRRHLAARGAPRGSPHAASSTGRAPHRTARPGPGLALATGRVLARRARGVRGRALARDQAPARPAGQLFRPGPRPQRPPHRARLAQAGPPPGRRAAGRVRRTHSRGRGGAARCAQPHGPQAVGAGARTGSKLPEGQAQAQAQEEEGQAGRGQVARQEQQPGQGREGDQAAVRARGEGRVRRPSQRPAPTTPRPRPASEPRPNSGQNSSSDRR